MKTEQQRFFAILNYGPEQIEQLRFSTISELWSRVDRLAKVLYDSELFREDRSAKVPYDSELWSCADRTAN